MSDKYQSLTLLRLVGGAVRNGIAMSVVMRVLRATGRVPLIDTPTWLRCMRGTSGEGRSWWPDGNDSLINVIQINIGWSFEGQQMARDHDAGVIVASEFGCNMGEYSWYNDSFGRATLFIDASTPIEVLSHVNNGFRWAQVGGKRIYSVYCSPNVSFDEFSDWLARLEFSVRGSPIPVIVAGDLNTKSPDW